MIASFLRHKIAVGKTASEEMRLEKTGSDDADPTYCGKQFQHELRGDRNSSAAVVDSRVRRTISVGDEAEPTYTVVIAPIGPSRLFVLLAVRVGSKKKMVIIGMRAIGVARVGGCRGCRCTPPQGDEKTFLGIFYGMRQNGVILVRVHPRR